MPEISAGILLYRQRRSGREVFLVHPGGPFWAKKDEAGWSIPKGLIDPGEDPEAAARREFAEEVGAVPPGPLVLLAELRLSGSKRLVPYALEGEFDPAELRNGMAAPLGPAAELSRSRSRGVVRRGRGQA